MKLVGLMLVRNEDWVLGCSLRAALKWCDNVVLYAHNCDDKTAKIAADVGRSSTGWLYAREVRSAEDTWDEMDIRQRMLEDGRQIGGTHFAIIDGNEVLTHNLLPEVYYWFKKLRQGQTLEVPMVPVWEGVRKYRDDGSVWCKRNDLTLGFADAPHLTWKPREDGYQYHHRPPHGIEDNMASRPISWGMGGVMHLQFANKRRLLAKHVLYRMVDHLRWPGRRSVKQLNRIYDEALSPPGNLTQVPDSWWGLYPDGEIWLDGVPWRERLIRQLLETHGRDAFAGLDLKGF